MEGRIDRCLTLFNSAIVRASYTDRQSLIATRATAATKARFAALAARQGMSESALLTLLIDTVLRDNESSGTEAAEALHRFGQPSSASGDRITLRLRAGDRQGIEARAALRRMSLSRYVVSLVRAHVRKAPPMPTVELDTLKVTVNALSAVNRTLIELRCALGPSHSTGGGTTALLGDLLTRVHAVHQAVGDVVRANLISWEAGDG